MGPVIRAQMPEMIRKATENAQVGQIIGPLQIEGRYCLLKVEQLLPASLEGALKRDLENLLFEEWLKEKLQNMNVKLNLII
jgi:parvulin-like peptidyl-prolyl isomerase